MRSIFAFFLLVHAVAAMAQSVETRDDALLEDAGQYAGQFRVPLNEAARRLKAQQDSVETTDAIRREFADRLAGISIEHAPEFRIVVLLTGPEPVTRRSAGGVLIEFRTGAKVTQDQAVAAMRRHL